jgi:hypothetical protein
MSKSVSMTGYQLLRNQQQPTATNSNQQQPTATNSNQGMIKYKYKYS